MMHFIRWSVAGLVFCATALSPATGATINWTTWKTKPTGTAAEGTLMVGSTGVGVSYSGEIAFAQLNGSGTNFFTPATTFTAPPAVMNSPPSDMIAIDGTATTHMITFSTPVVDPVMEIVSLGQSAVHTQYTFSLSGGQSMAILAQGPSAAFGGCATCLTLTGSTIEGREGDGLIQFTGTFKSLIWTGANPEFWNGITVGATGLPVPEPETWGLMLLGLGLALTRIVRLRACHRGRALRHNDVRMTIG
jgi:PEP-CTERM motif-containing protein